MHSFVGQSNACVTFMCKVLCKQPDTQAHIQVLSEEVCQKHYKNVTLCQI